MLRSRSWFGTNWNRPKNRLSLDHLKYLYSVLERNAMVSENNRGLLVESLRCIAEILIWGDQHDSSVFDFFLEKNMLSYFLHIMRQKNGGSSFVCVQLLQTLNILFENIRNETSLYYLLSNNHVNSIIVHKFDFSDEDVMGYYILFLKTLSLKLNIHTIHFFFNEHTNDFPLYTEAIKFFNHPESMVRIAVRTITLNVYRIQNTSMLQFIRDKTAAPYFSNLVWFIGKHIVELDCCVKNIGDQQMQRKLSNLVAEHLDHLHYLNDILHLEITDLNAVLTAHLLHKLFVPLYIFSLTPAVDKSIAEVTKNLATILKKEVNIDAQEAENPRISPVVSIYLLSLVFLVITHAPLVHSLAWLLLNGDYDLFKDGSSKILNMSFNKKENVASGFSQQQESFEREFETAIFPCNFENPSRINKSEYSFDIQKINITDEEKQKIKTTSSDIHVDKQRPYLDLVLSSLNCTENDYLALMSLCLLYALAYNKGGSVDLLEDALSKNEQNNSTNYKTTLIDKLLHIIILSSKQSNRVRLITLEISLNLLLYLTKPFTKDHCINNNQQSSLISAKNQSMKILYNFYKSEDIFLDLFENEYNDIKKSTLNVEFLCMDPSILMQPTEAPMAGVPLSRRLPVDEVEKARKAIRIFFLLRKTCQKYLNETENSLPLTNFSNCVEINNVLDLNNKDLISCTVVNKNLTKQRRFLVIDNLQFILVEPDAKRLGWGVAKFVGFLQDIEVSNDKEDSRCLHITVQSKGATHSQSPILDVKFVFDDHIRCMASKQRLIKGRSKARQKKMYQIAQLLEIPIHGVDSLAYNTSEKVLARGHTQLFSISSGPGFAAALGRNCKTLNRGVSRVQIVANGNLERSEEIPLEDFQKSRSSGSSQFMSSNGQSSRLQSQITKSVQEAKEITNSDQDIKPNTEILFPSDETSFIGEERNESKRGAIQDV
ncbi:protein CLEC16A homolog [Condylostylus longicornis]|uniref:protein CLEC16A homolog n=1 Tax=Condylostylus longicornis TaxID=2530218 RepID=UPI00244DC289|nr:protein CLEC16A homolog [Condylostylus longicornis]